MRKLLRHLFPGYGAIYLFICLTGLAVGLWPEWVWPISSDIRPAPLPTLRTLVLAQILFFILAWPVVQFRRVEETSLGWQVIESAGLFFLTIPFYFVCAWLGDATLIDCLRALLVVLAVAPVGWVAGKMLREQIFRGPVLLGLVLIVLGLPGVYYFLCEFYPQISIDWLWRICPVGLAWSGATSRETFLLPQPLWAFAFWPVIAVVLLLISLCNRYQSR